MDLVDWSRGRVRVDPRRVRRVRHAPAGARPDVHPGVGAQGRQRRHAVEGTCPGTTARRCCRHLERLHVASDRNLVDVRFPVQYVIRPQSEGRARLPRLRRDGRVRACSSRATRSWSCRAGLETTIAGDRHGRRPGRRGLPADGRDDHARRRARHQRAATCSAGRTTCRRSRRSIDARCAGWTRPPPSPRAQVRDQAHDPLGAGHGPRHRLPDRRQHAPPRRGRRPSSRSTRSGGSSCG